jgi:hypothetical protein
MNELEDIGLLILTCVLANHMGLISAIETVIGRRLPIVNCIKCSTFWSVLVFCLLSRLDMVISIPISFLSSYMAIWLELFFGYIDTCYEKIYNAIYKDSETTTQTGSSNTDPKGSEDSMS